VRDGTLLDYSGTFAEFLDYKARLAAKAAEEASGGGTSGANGSASGARTPTLADVPIPSEEPKRGRRLNPIKLKQMQVRRAELEEEAARLEAEIAQTEAELAVFVSAEQSQRQSQQLDALRARLDAAMHEWAEVSEAIEAEEAE
jgi:ATP-binding cassette subfamily F protein 3